MEKGYTLRTCANEVNRTRAFIPDAFVLLVLQVPRKVNRLYFATCCP